MARERISASTQHLQALIRETQANPTTVVGGKGLRHGLAFVRAQREEPTDVRPVLNALREEQPGVSRRVQDTLVIAEALVRRSTSS